MDTKPMFSVTLIAKNEERSLPSLLASLSEFRARGGEILLVDTGSTDKTVSNVPGPNSDGPVCIVSDWLNLSPLIVTGSRSSVTSSPAIR